MKTLFTFIVLLAKLYIGVRILIWGISEIYYPELHNLSEIEGYLVFAVFDIWIFHSTNNFNSTKEED